MSVMVDHERLEVEQLGLRTVGQVLSHLQRDNRLVVNLLIDGQEPDLDRLGAVKQAPINGHTLFIETAQPGDMALEVLGEIENQLGEAERLKTEAVELIQRSGAAGRAMEKLSACFRTWQTAHEALLKTAQLLRLDLDHVQADGRSIADMLAEFTSRLRDIKRALENRDFVTLGDVLAYEMADTTAQWAAALSAVRDVVYANAE